MSKKIYFSNELAAHDFSTRIGGDVETVFGKSVVTPRTARPESEPEEEYIFSDDDEDDGCQVESMCF